jgi:hypothetical protein
MSRNTKIILGVVAGLIVVCLCGVAAVFGVSLFTAGQVVKNVSQNMSTDPQAVNADMAKIADAQMPSGFTGAYSMELMGMALVGYNGSDGHSHIMMMQFPNSMNISTEEMQRQMDQMAGSTGNYNYGDAQMKVVDQFDVTVRGEDVTAVVSEGQSGDGKTIKQIMVPFTGKGGPAMLLYVAPSDSFDQQMIEDFLTSMQ